MALSLGYLAWQKLQLLALLGIIPRELSILTRPPCPCCIATSMVKLPTMTKGIAPVRNIHPTTRPEQCVSVDQTECSTPGFILKLKGRLSRKRYRVTTLFIDHIRFDFYLQPGINNKCSDISVTTYV